MRGLSQGLFFAFFFGSFRRATIKSSYELEAFGLRCDSSLYGIMTLAALKDLNQSLTNLNLATHELSSYWIDSPNSILVDSHIGYYLMLNNQVR